MEKRKLLLATTNSAKVKEMTAYLESLPFAIISLLDLPEKITPPDEPFETTDLNALVKAKYYAEQTGYLSLADDSGLFVEVLAGWPGVHSARIGNTDDERMNAVIQKLQGVRKEQRQANFKTTLVLYDPADNSIVMTSGQEPGIITEEPVKERRAGFGYDPIFFVSELGKTYAEATLEEKNKTSHRGKALEGIKRKLKSLYGGKQLVVPCALIIQDGKLLLQKRNDPHRSEFHGKWEYPGGGVELGENLTENVIREVKEETGLIVEPLRMLQRVEVIVYTQPTFMYQIFLVPFVCKIIGGSLAPRDQEVSEAKWVEIDEVSNYELLNKNKEFFDGFVDELKQAIVDYKL